MTWMYDGLLLTPRINIIIVMISVPCMHIDIIINAHAHIIAIIETVVDRNSWRDE